MVKIDSGRRKGGKNRGKMNGAFFLTMEWQNPKSEMTFIAKTLQLSITFFGSVQKKVSANRKLHCCLVQLFTFCKLKTKILHEMVV